MVTVYVEKCFRALIDSGATISLMHTSVYNMMDEPYKTSMLSTVVNLKTADGSPILSMGKATHQLWIADFKFSQCFQHM